jgi:hypothetical protein
VHHIWKDLLTNNSVTVALMRKMGLTDVATAEADVNNVPSQELGSVFQR